MNVMNLAVRAVARDVKGQFPIFELHVVDICGSPIEDYHEISIHGLGSGIFRRHQGTKPEVLIGIPPQPVSRWPCRAADKIDFATCPVVVEQAFQSRRRLIMLSHDPRLCQGRRGERQCAKSD